MAKKENQARSILVMKPSVPSRLFDAVLVPRHDKMKMRSHVFVTDKALSLVSEERMSQEAENLSREFKIAGDLKTIGLLVGGDAGSFKFSQDVLEKILADIRQVSLETGASVLATSSRRSPLWVDELLKKTWLHHKACPLLVIANESNRPGVVDGILGLSDVIVVSGESISMVSEAATSGKPVIVFMPNEGSNLKPKLRNFLEGLNRSRQISLVTSEFFYQSLKTYLGSVNGDGSTGLCSDRDVLRQAVRRVV